MRCFCCGEPLGDFYWRSSGGNPFCNEWCASDEEEAMKQTHCGYRGCMKPLGKSYLKGDDGKFYCDKSCVERQKQLVPSERVSFKEFKETGGWE